MTTSSFVVSASCDLRRLRSSASADEREQN